MIELNTYHIGDAVEFLQKLQGQNIAGVITSPPYNKAFAGRGKRPGSNWKNSKLMSDNYTHFDDNLPEDEYVAWQRSVLEASLECVGEHGVVLYNIGRKIKQLREDRRQAIVEGLPVRQTIIWNRGSSLNQGGKRPTILPPVYELIYVLAGDKWRLPEQYVSEMRFWGDVWHIPPARNNPHPAPFPEELALRMVKLADGVVVDPFAGSGTVGIAALQAGVPYILNDLSQEYQAMFYERREQTNLPTDGS